MNQFKVRRFIFLWCECKCNIVIFGLVTHKLIIFEISKKKINIYFHPKYMKKTSSTLVSLFNMMFSGKTILLVLPRINDQIYFFGAFCCWTNPNTKHLYVICHIFFQYELTLILLTWVWTSCMHLSCITYKLKRSMDLWSETHGLFTLDNKFHVYGISKWLND